MTPIDAAVREEIEGLHRFLVGWFTGALADNVFDGEFADRLSPDVVFIPPAGRLLGRDDLVASVRAARGSNPDFRIAIRNVQVHRQADDVVVATYEEWQRHALSSTPPDNGRISTVLFKTPAPLRWLHIHETWLPAEIMAAGPYDF